MSSSKAKISILAALLIGLTACHPGAPTSARAAAPAGPSAPDSWVPTRDSFIEDYLKAQPFFAAQAGRHEFDGQMPDLSAAGIERESARLQAWRTRLAGLDTSGFSDRDRFEREYAMSVVDNDLFWLDKARAPFTNPAWYLNQIDPDMYLSRKYAPPDVRMKAYIQYARAIPKIAADIEANLKPPMPATYVKLAIDSFGGYADFYRRDVAPVFADVKDAALQKQLAAADEAAAKAMTRLKGRFDADRKTENEKFALGKALFAEMLEDTERVDAPIDQIEAAGRADLARNTAALKAACAAYLPNGTLAACVAHMQANKPQGGSIEAARMQLEMLEQFVVDHHIVSVPSGENALVAEAPPYNRSNFAFIQVPGPYDKGVASVYNIAPPDPKWSKEKQDAYIPGEADLMFTSVHEVWPGHFVQFLHSNSNPSKLEGLWVGYGFAEGWAHYCEQMMFEMGFGNGDPEMHIGQLTEALLRDVRLLSAIGMQTEGMTPAQSEKMFTDVAFQDPGNAEQQAARGTYDPEYLNYTLGKLMILKLRADWVAKQLQGKAATEEEQHQLWRKFHDEFLSYGGPPIPLLRKEMLGSSAGSLL